MTTTLHAVTIGVGHLRRQVAFYGSNLGLRVAAKGRVPAAVSRQAWGLDDDLDVVTLARQDLPQALQVRLMRTSDLAARPDFDLTVPGPVGLAFGARDVRRLLGDAGIIRNRLKVAAAITNAKTILALRESHGGFHGWLLAHHPRPKAEWVKLFRKTYKFTGGEIVGEVLMSTGYLPGAHREDCPVFKKLARLSPPWMRG